MRALRYLPAFPLFLACLLLIGCAEDLIEEEPGVISTSQPVIGSDLAEPDDPIYAQVMGLFRRLELPDSAWLPYCSSTLVHNSSDEGARAWLLTASHCVSAYYYSYKLEEGVLATDLPSARDFMDLDTWEVAPEYVDSHPDDFFMSDCVRRSYISVIDNGQPWRYEPGGVINDVALVRLEASFDGVRAVELGAPGTLPERPIKVTVMGFGMDLACRGWPYSVGDNAFQRQTRDLRLPATGSPLWFFDFANHVGEVVGAGDSGGPVLYHNRVYGVHHICYWNGTINESTRTDHNESDCLRGEDPTYGTEDGPYDWIQARLVDHDDSRDCVAYPGGGYRWLEAVKDGCDVDGENCCPSYTVWGDACGEDDDQGEDDDY